MSALAGLLGREVATVEETRRFLKITLH